MAAHINPLPQHRVNLKVLPLGWNANRYQQHLFTENLFLPTVTNVSQYQKQREYSGEEKKNYKEKSTTMVYKRTHT